MVNANFVALWERLMAVAVKTKDDRLKATLMNHEGRKEHICRKLGVVTEADIKRVEAKRHLPY